jgi:hypothetical protein
MRNGEPYLIVAAAAAGWLAVAWLPSGILRTAITLPFALWLPGYALLRALHKPLLVEIEGFCFAVGASMAAIIAAGFVLNAVHGLDPFGWASILAAIIVVPTLSEAFASSGSKSALPAEPRVTPGPDRHLDCWTAPAVISTLASLLVTGIALAASSEGITRFREFKYTEFWVVPDHAGRNDTLRVGIRNMEGEPSVYDLELRFGDKMVSQVSSIALGDGEVLVTPFTLPYDGPYDGKSAMRAEARLYRSGDHRNLYRQTWLNFPHQQQMGQ